MPTHERACRQARELVGAWQEGELDSATRAALHRHLERCPACADYSAAYRRSVALARLAWRPSPSELELPAALRRRWVARLRAAACKPPAS